MYRGYPSGTILVWETEQEAPVRDLAVPQAENPFQGHKLLMDGQQRLTSLFAVFNGEPVRVRGRSRPVEILFNLNHPDGPPTETTEVDDDQHIDPDEPDEGEETARATTTVQENVSRLAFVVASRALKLDPHWVPVSDVLSRRISDTQVLKKLVKSFDDPLYERYSKRLEQLRRIQDYQYVMHVLEKDLSYEEVTEIFVRVNSLGMKLKGSDLALAQITSRWRDSLKLFECFAEQLKQQGFSIELGLLVRTLVVFATDQSRFRTIANISVASLKKGWEKTTQALEFALNYLRSNAGIEDESLLSSPLLIIVVAYYADACQYRLSTEDERHLRKWVYVASARGHYSGSSETTLDADLNVIQSGRGPIQLLEVLKQEFGRLEIEPGDLEGRGPRSPLFAAAYIALRARGAKDWQTQLRLSLSHQGNSHCIQSHHIFPKVRLKEAGVSVSLINEIANMAFVAGRTNRTLASQPPDSYLPELVQRHGPELLSAHCLPTDPSLWSTSHFEEFLVFRRKALSEAINEFIGRAKPPDAAELSIADLIAQGETETVEFKSSARWDYREGRQNKALELVIVKTIAGFLNSAGGTLLIGVADDGSILGLNADLRTLGVRQDRDGYAQFLVNLFSTVLGKDILASYIQINFEAVNGYDVCRVRALPSSVPVYVADGDRSRFYVRIANTTREFDTEEYVNYVGRKWAARA